MQILAICPESNLLLMILAEERPLTISKSEQRKSQPERKRVKKINKSVWKKKNILEILGNKAVLS